MRAALLDVDGTLVDSIYQHVRAWATAFDEQGHHVPQWKIHRAMGMGSEQLLDSLLGEDLAGRIGDAAKARHSELFFSSAGTLHAFDGAADLVAALAERGLRVVLASSAAPEELELLMEVVKPQVEVYAATSSGDVENAKPEPDLVLVALERAGVDASEAFMVGDACADMQAATKAGVLGIGLLTGGLAATELQVAGASFVFADPRELAEHLDEIL